MLREEVLHPRHVLGLGVRLLSVERRLLGTELVRERLPGEEALGVGVRARHRLLRPQAARSRLRAAEAIVPQRARLILLGLEQLRERVCLG